MCRHTLQELLNETMSEGLLVFISDHMHPSMRSALHHAERVHECVALALGLSQDPSKLVSRATQDLALGLTLLLNTKSTIAQCCTTYQPGHADRCTGLWAWCFDAMVDAVSAKAKFYLPNDDDDPVGRMCVAFATIIRHVVMNWNKGACVLYHLSQHPAHVRFMLDHVEYDDMRDAIVRLIYCDHSYATMELVKGAKIISLLLQRLTSLPWSADKDNVESVLCSLIFAPYISPRGDLIFVKSIPKDKLTGEPDYVQLCGTSRDMAYTPMRLFTSRKIRHLVHMVMEQHHVPSIAQGMLDEFSHYGLTTARVSFGCTRHFTSLCELVTTVEFSERTGKGHIGIECQYMHCQTHVMVQGKLVVNGQPNVPVVLNCMLGLSIELPDAAPQIVALEIITSVEARSSMEVVVHCKGRDDVVLTTASRADKEMWITHFENALKGNVDELDIFCSDDWKSNIEEYQGLRLAVVETMEQRAVELSLHVKAMAGAAAWPLLHLCDLVQAIVGMQSKRMDTMLVACGLVDWLLDAYTTVHTSWILTRVSQIVVFYLSDPNCKRSRTCPVVAHVMEHGPNKLQRGPSGFTQCIFETIDQCLHVPHSNSSLRVGQLASESKAWMDILHDVVPRAEPLHPSAIPSILKSAAFSRPPAFQKDILDLLAQPSFASYDIGSSFLVGNGCVFGYVYKQEGHYWKRALVVFEQSSYKLWSFIPSQQKQYAAINWQWMVPTSVVPHFCQGEDELHTSIGHHGFDVMSDAQHNNVTWNFCTTALHERDEWLQVLETAAATIAAIAQHTMTKPPSKGSSRECVGCQVTFHVFRRPHPCLRCGRPMCSKCTKNYMKPIPEMAIHTPVCHCQECFESTGGAMSEMFPTLIQGGSPSSMNGMDGSAARDVDRVGPDLDSINKSRQSGSRRQLYHIDITTESDHSVEDDLEFSSTRGVTFPTTPLEVEDEPFAFPPSPPTAK
ncbi:hypothetical protein, variant [Aphanomyces invadans]|uniref:FYVE-type domain-containing protein n=1 Tax=Aphanomyces invadans TaxID=157072 RepID=A0A024U8Y6_9STRA|nr:hypothetical protein, variant [Aphanomyces invadans]ETW02866.1 hypothetical protein, variant [Aphanomyces invadans]|eukprot:XP_008868250.1 hypothetical protein, variant [Aphanomyces invadans]